MVLKLVGWVIVLFSLLLGTFDNVHNKNCFCFLTSKVEKISHSVAAVTSHLTSVFFPFSAWQGRPPCSPPALTHNCCSLCPADPLKSGGPGTAPASRGCPGTAVHSDGGELDSTGSQPSRQASGASSLHPRTGGPEQWLRARGPHKVSLQLSGASSTPVPVDYDHLSAHPQ